MAGRGGHFDIDEQWDARDGSEWFPGESCLSSHLSARVDQSLNASLLHHLFDAPTMASHALKQVRIVVSTIRGNTHMFSFHRRLHPSLYSRHKRMHYSPCSISTHPLSPQLPPSRLRERLRRGSRFPLPVGLQYGRS